MFNPDNLNLGGQVGFIFGGRTSLCLAYLWLYQLENARHTFWELDKMSRKGIAAREFRAYGTNATAMGEVAKEKERK